MGIVRNGPPAELILRLKNVYHIEDFIETGTYRGDTSLWAASHFSKVYTIEYSKDIYEDTVKRLDNNKKISLFFGDSRLILQQILPQLRNSALFWIDSHWSGGNTYGKNDECPLIDEILLINGSEIPHFLFIDDARLFLSPPPRPHQINQWPPIDKVIKAINSGSFKYYIVIIEDVIISVPDYAKNLVMNYCQDISTQAWENYFKKWND